MWESELCPGPEIRCTKELLRNARTSVAPKSISFSVVFLPAPPTHFVPSQVTDPSVTFPIICCLSRYSNTQMVLSTRSPQKRPLHLPLPLPKEMCPPAGLLWASGQELGERQGGGVGGDTRSLPRTAADSSQPRNRMLDTKRVDQIISTSEMKPCCSSRRARE